MKFEYLTELIRYNVIGFGILSGISTQQGSCNEIGNLYE